MKPKTPRANPRTRVVVAVLIGARPLRPVPVLNVSSGERKISHWIPHLYSVGDTQFVRSIGDQTLPATLEAIP